MDEPNPFSDAATPRQRPAPRQPTALNKPPVDVGGGANPYQSPTFEASFNATLVPFTREQARFRLLGPGVGLILFAVFWLIYTCFVGYVMFIDVRRGEVFKGDDAAETIGFIIGMVFVFACFVVPSLVTLAGGIQMIRVKTYGFCWAAAILAVVPCTMCFPVLFPFGIWGMVALYDARMRPAFSHGASPFQANN